MKDNVDKVFFVIIFVTNVFKALYMLENNPVTGFSEIVYRITIIILSLKANRNI